MQDKIYVPQLAQGVPEKVPEKVSEKVPETKNGKLPDMDQASWKSFPERIPGKDFQFAGKVSRKGFPERTSSHGGHFPRKDVLSIL